jgi:hypothetical protein
MIPIYITSFFRFDFTLETINKIHERTKDVDFQIHIYDNGSDPETQKKLFDLLQEKRICSLQLDSRNTGCLYDKAVFQAMTESSEKYYIVSDNDIFAPNLAPSWLSQMITIMDNHPELAMLTPQFPPQHFSEPYQILEDIVYCKAVGNALKLVRREAYPFIDQKIGAFGDDGLLSAVVMEQGWKVAFCKDIFCFHAGQCPDWGYKTEEINKDPRKAGYGEPFKYELENSETYRPMPQWRI